MIRGSYFAEEEESTIIDETEETSRRSTRCGRTESGIYGARSGRVRYWYCILQYSSTSLFFSTDIPRSESGS